MGRPICTIIPTYLVPFCPILLEIPTYPKMGRPLWTFPKSRPRIAAFQYYSSKDHGIPISSKCVLVNGQTHSVQMSLKILRGGKVGLQKDFQSLGNPIH